MSLNPQLFIILNSSVSVKQLLGAQPLRVYPWDEAPEDPVKPYALYSVFSASPENYVDSVPDIDNLSTQVTIYSDTSDKCTECFIAVRNAIEPKAHMTNFSTPTRDKETKLYSCRLDFDFWENR